MSLFILFLESVVLPSLCYKEIKYIWPICL
uniref:Uncharacterized protein n=1 Tax=Rhizophora mucronata TaxID=61149 RepID=A0A2P2PFB7_RHIMU